jgi:L-serine/L-threonine ammonia-lyase
VEPACGASVAAIYGGVIQRLQSEGKLPAKMESGIVVIVCGGISITQNMLADWKNDFQLE